MNEDEDFKHFKQQPAYKIRITIDVGFARDVGLRDDGSKSKIYKDFAKQLMQWCAHFGTNGVIKFYPHWTKHVLEDDFKQKMSCEYIHENSDEDD